MQTTYDHVPCIRCEYDLFGHSPSGACPECGFPLTLSLDTRRLFFVPANIIRPLNRCLLVWVLGVAVWMTSAIMGWSNVRPPLLERAFGLLVVATSMIVPAVFCTYALKCYWTRLRFSLVVLALLGGIATFVLFMAPSILYIVGVEILVQIRSNVGYVILNVSVVCLHIAAAVVVYRIPDWPCCILLLVTAAAFAIAMLLQNLPAMYRVLTLPLFLAIVFGPYILSVLVVLWAWRRIRHVDLLKQHSAGS